MAHLYISTDFFQAEFLIENPDFGEETRYKYHEVDFLQGENLAKKIGFNPMTAVEMNGKISERELDSIATSLVKDGFYVATEVEGKIQRYTPNDIETRDELVKLALQKEYGKKVGSEPALCLLMYSNNPNQIRDFNSFQSCN